MEIGLINEKEICLWLYKSAGATIKGNIYLIRECNQKSMHISK